MNLTKLLFMLCLYLSFQSCVPVKDIDIADKIDTHRPEINEYKMGNGIICYTFVNDLECVKI